MKMFLLQNTMISLGDTYDPYDPDNPDPDPPPPDPEIATVGLYQVDPSVTEGASATFELRRSGNVNKVVEALIDASSSGGDADLVINPTYEYQWTRNNVAIPEANASTYRTVTADAGKAIRCTVTLRNTIGTTVATSNAITATVPTNNPSGLPWKSSNFGGSLTDFEQFRGRALDWRTSFFGPPSYEGTTLAAYNSWKTVNCINSDLINMQKTGLGITLTVPLCNTYHRRKFDKIAAGEVDFIHRDVANIIKTNAKGNVVNIRLGHEANAGRYPWHFWEDTNHQGEAVAIPADYKAAWKRVALIYRGILPNCRLQWNCIWKNGWVTMPFALDTYYPGNDCVDVIGLDVYDSSSGIIISSDADWTKLLGSYNTTNGQVIGLEGHRLYAVAKGKKYSIDEWAPMNLTGLSSNGTNNNYFIPHMYDWFAAHAGDMEYESYFNLKYTTGTAGELQHVISPQSAALTLPIASQAYKDKWTPPAP